MKLDRFLEQIHRLLLEGRKSQATDLLTEYLLDVYGRPVGLNLPTLHVLSQKPPGEIVAILKRLLGHPQVWGGITQFPFDTESLMDDDLELIESTSDDIELACEYYQPDEEWFQEGPDERISTAPVLAAEPHQIKSSSSESQPSIASLNVPPASFKKHPTAVFPFSCPDIDLGNNADPRAILKPVEGQLSLFDFEEVAEPSLDDNFAFGEEFESLENNDDDEGSYEYLLDDDDLIVDLEDDVDLGGRDDLCHVDHDGTLTQDERAYQVALSVGLDYGWTKEGIGLLHEVFMERGWAQAQVAMRNALSTGKTVDEVRLAKELKDLWEARDDFSIAFYNARKDQSDCTYQGGRVLSWVMAFKVIKLFAEKTDISEIEFFLEREFDLWFRPRVKKRSFGSFLDHLKNRTTSGGNLEGITPDCVDLVGYEGWSCEENSEKDAIGTPLYFELVDLGLIPDFWLDYLDHSMGPPDATLLKDFIGT